MLDTDIPLGMRLKEIAGWNQLEKDWKNFLSFRPQGCFVAEWEGVPVGTVTTVDFQSTVGWIGMLLVDPDYRRKGIGTRLLDTAIESLEDCEVAKRDATPMGKYVYVQRGFGDEVMLERWTRATGPADGPSPPANGKGMSVRPMQATDLPHAIPWDASVFGVAREQVLGSWLENAPHYGLIAERGNEIAGYCLGRPGSRFDQIGPLLAKTRKVAQVLFHRALAEAGSRGVVVDTFTGDPEWSQLLKDLGFASQREFYRMARGKPFPMLRPEWYWLSAGPEIG